LQVDPQRLTARIAEMAMIGAAGSGCNRQALTDEDKAGRDLFVNWGQEHGLSATVDQIGNIFLRREGRIPGLAPILIGSHLDTQPTGGKFDGVVGVIAGLEVLARLREAGITPERPMEVAVWTNEEGARFKPAMLGSAVFAGLIDWSAALQTADDQGKLLGEELARIGYAGNAPCTGRAFHSALELHIEQGPILEDNDKQIGLVTGVQAVRWFEILLEGEPAHAGTTPMERRRDVFRAVPALLEQCYALANTSGAMMTFGASSADPGVANTVPRSLSLTLDVRHADDCALDRLSEAIARTVEQTAKDAGVGGKISQLWHSSAVTFDAECIATARAAVAALGYSSMPIVSGAGHDSVCLARAGRAGMIFIPCRGGLSHNPQEFAEPRDIEAGANVLLHTALALAGTQSDIH
jgi:N-carbamoyl-L-amino-acid hydrolase